MLEALRVEERGSSAIHIFLLGSLFLFFKLFWVVSFKHMFLLGALKVFVFRVSQVYF